MRIRPLWPDERRPLARTLINLGVLAMSCGCSGIIGPSDHHALGFAMLFAGPVLMLVGVLLPPKRAQGTD